MHEHWKKAARLAPQEKRGHANCIAKSENCPRSLQRVMKLRESSYHGNTPALSVYTEQTKMPWCFLTGIVDDNDALDCFCQYGISYLEDSDEILNTLSGQKGNSLIRDETYSETIAIHIVKVCCSDDHPVQIGLFHEGKYGWTISTSELVQCYAYTPCTLIVMTPPGRRLSDICTPSRHYTVQKVIAIPTVKKLCRVDRSDVDSTLTPLGPNHTAATASPSAKECYSQDHNRPIGPCSVEISPTVPWTNAQDAPRVEGSDSRQMPLLRKSSDNPAPKKNPQSAPKMKDPVESKKASSTPLGSKEISSKAKDALFTKEPELCSTQDQKMKNHGKVREKLTHSDRKGAILQGDEKPPLAAGKHSPLSSQENTPVNQDPQTESDQCPGGSRNQCLHVEENKQVATFPCKAIPSESYALAIAGELIVPISQMAEAMGITGPETPAGLQQLVPPKKVSQSSQGDKEQAQGCEMPYASVVADTRKRRVKKDIASKSCPPSIRAISPAFKNGRNASHDRSYKKVHSMTLGKITESSQRERSRNRILAVEEVSGLYDASANAENTSSPMEVQHPQEVQNTVDLQDHIVDLIAKLEQEEAEQKKERRITITDSTRKWCNCLSKPHQDKIISLGEKFLRRMDSTMCFLIVAFRMLAKANWNRSMVAIDIKQAALYAISKGWYVKAEEFHEYPFTGEEFAVSAATYLDQIPAETLEDPFRAMYVVISHLPHSCAKLFSKGSITWPFCHASCDVPIPSFTSNISWTMESWG